MTVKSTCDNTRLNYSYTVVTWREFDHNGIPYDEAIEEEKALLKDAIVVGYDIKI